MGLAAVNPGNPQSWNRYAYVLNNPMLLVDPFGDQDQCYASSPICQINGTPGCATSGGCPSGLLNMPGAPGPQPGDFVNQAYNEYAQKQLGEFFWKYYANHGQNDQLFVDIAGANGYVFVPGGCVWSSGDAPAGPCNAPGTYMSVDDFNQSAAQTLAGVQDLQLMGWRWSNNEQDNMSNRLAGALAATGLNSVTVALDCATMGGASMIPGLNDLAGAPTDQYPGIAPVVSLSALGGAAITKGSKELPELGGYLQKIGPYLIIPGLVNAGAMTVECIDGGG
jgi:hypothetical protein